MNVRLLLGCVFVLGVARTAFAQPMPSAALLAPPPNELALTTDTLLREQLEPSYIAYPIVFSGVDKVLYEASIAPHIVAYRKSWPVAFVFTPKILIRMWNEAQEPVRTPSYMPRLTMFAWPGGPERTHPFVYGSLTLEHHSNGQAGPLIKIDGGIYHQGDFTTNDIDLSIHLARPMSSVFSNHQLGLRLITRLFFTEGLPGRYGFWRLQYTTTLFESRSAIRSRLVLGMTAILDRAQTSTHDRTMRVFEHFPIALQLVAEPRHLNAGLFVRYYVGQDYYNLWFDRVAHMLEIGIDASFGSVLNP
jgi:hypothetical protein